MNAKTSLSLKSDTKTKQPQRVSLSQIPIEQRRVRFDFNDIEHPFFFSENPIISAYWVALSATFPIGEAEFIKSVKLYEDQILDDDLNSAIADFTAQEAHHSFQHKLINKKFEQHGYQTTNIESFMKEKYSNRSKSWSHKKRIMRTVSAEHITAVIAHFILTNPQALDGVPESFQNLFFWHSIEEIEHKSVTFDVYQHCVGDMRALKWHYAAFVFFEFPLKMMMMTRYLLKQKDLKSTWRQRLGMFTFLFGKKGMVRSVTKFYIMFLKPGFHPWQHNDSALVAQWKEKLVPHIEESRTA